MSDVLHIRMPMKLIKTAVFGVISLLSLGAIGGVMLAGYIIIVHS